MVKTKKKAKKVVNPEDNRKTESPKKPLYDKNHCKEENISSVLKNIVSIDWNFSNINGGNGLFGLHPYPAKFISQIPQKIIECLDIY